MENPHASRAKQMMYEKRYNDIIDRMIAEERRESLALQQIIFPIVALFISTGFVAVFKPLFWSTSSIPGKIIMLTLFIVGVLHLLKRIHFGLERYTYSSIHIHDSLFSEIEEDKRPYSRLQAISFLIIGIIISLVIGLIISNLLGMMTSAMMPRLFAESFHFEFLFYPPIVVLFVDLMHSVASNIEQ
jgi:ABC-type antimicrobial peptide transport system permease subunit